MVWDEREGGRIESSRHVLDVMMSFDTEKLHERKLYFGTGAFVNMVSV